MTPHRQKSSFIVPLPKKAIGHEIQVDSPEMAELVQYIAIIIQANLVLKSGEGNRNSHY